MPFEPFESFDQFVWIISVFFALKTYAFGVIYIK